VTGGTAKEMAADQAKLEVVKAGWATMPGSSEPNRNVAKECIKVLSAQF
jgi:hypothetical protein